MNETKWEIIENGAGLVRIKVEGGHIYSFKDINGPMCFVPDIDLQRYQSHLRDAYTQGYQAGQEDAKKGIKEDI